MFLTRSPRLRTLATCGALALLALVGLPASQAHARVFIGVGVGVPLFYPPYVGPPLGYYPPYYPPPYYAPPAVYAPPDNSFSYTPPSSQPRNLSPPQGYPQQGYAPGGYAPGGGYGVAQSCQAGAYVCPLTADTPPGGRCSCPGHDGQRVRGQAN